MCGSIWGDPLVYADPCLPGVNGADEVPSPPSSAGGPNGRPPVDMDSDGVDSDDEAANEQKAADKAAFVSASSASANAALSLSLRPKKPSKAKAQPHWFTTDKWMVKIGDLGVGRRVQNVQQMINTFYGTPLYLSPEVCRKEAYTFSTVLFFSHFFRFPYIS
jgi:hypothetical protein